MRSAAVALLIACTTPTSHAPAHSEQAYKETIADFLQSHNGDEPLRALLQDELDFRRPPVPVPQPDDPSLHEQEAAARADLVATDRDRRRMALRWLIESLLVVPTDRPAIAPIYGDTAADPSTRALAAAALLRIAHDSH